MCIKLSPTSLLVLALTAIAQIVIVVISGSVALAADTIHNFSDALTALPLWIAFALGTKAATRRYTYGFGRAEDLAGLFVIAMIALSAAIAGYEAIMRLIHPQPIAHVGWVALAGLVGFVGNEWVALYRMRIGRRIGSAALVADGMHARTDGFTSLAVLFSAGGALAVVPRGLEWPGSSPGLSRSGADGKPLDAAQAGNDSITSISSSGASQFSRCPASGTVTSRAPGIPAASRRE